ncbi:MAG: NAD(P)/FAD-dependent oxidoreductase [Balneolaceae bacterium]
MPAPVLHTDVIIAGGGPVGLYLAGILLQKNISVMILEQKTEIDRHSKSLGIHPVSLELFNEAGIADGFINRGLKIEKGMAFVDDQMKGELSFMDGPGPFNFILALPQYLTEDILEAWVQSLSPGALIRGATVNEIHQTEKKVTVRWKKDGEDFTADCNFLAGCDGKNSFVRQRIGIRTKGAAYPDTYIMGDFSDNTEFGSKAAIYLHREGLIESFPLPDSYRRWVAKTDQYIENPRREMLQELIESRIGHSLHQQKNNMLSSFGVQHQLAEEFFTGRILLAGDAAHVVSPIGGQGMNLGWINAHLLAESLLKATVHPRKRNTIFREYSKRGSRIARKAARRAEMNMWMGRKQNLPFFKSALVHLMVNTPFSKIALRRFTMRGLI